MQRLKRLPTPHLYQNRLSHLAGSTAVLFAMPPPPSPSALGTRVLLLCSALAIPPRRERCAPTGAAADYVPRVRPQMGGRIVMLDPLGFGPPRAALRIRHRRRRPANRAAGRAAVAAAPQGGEGRWGPVLNPPPQPRGADGGRPAAVAPAEAYGCRRGEGGGGAAGYCVFFNLIGATPPLFPPPPAPPLRRGGGSRARRREGK